MIIITDNAGSQWKNTLMFVCGVFMVAMLNFGTSFAKTNAQPPINVNSLPTTNIAVPVNTNTNAPVSASKIINANKLCVQPACTLANAGTLCRCGVKVGYGICSPAGNLCSRCKMCGHVDPRNNNLPQTAGSTN